MFLFLKQSNKSLYSLTIKLMIITITISVFVCCRVLFTGSRSYFFLMWNVFLAWIPVYFSLVYTNHKFKWRFCQHIIGFLWLVFYPNAPYMLTDFIHLSQYSFFGNSSVNLAIWYDFFLISMFVILGLVLGFMSLSVMHKYIEEKYNHILGWMFVFIISLLSGFAIYLGRFVRLNSWNVITNPRCLINTILVSFNFQTLGFVLLFGSLILMIYLTFFFVNQYYSQNR